MTPDQLKEAEQWAALPYTADQLATILGIKPAVLRIALDDPEDPLGNAIMRGRLIAKGDLYKKIITLSNQGSGPAQAMLRELFEKAEL